MARLGLLRKGGLLGGTRLLGLKQVSLTASLHQGSQLGQTYSNEAQKVEAAPSLRMHAWQTFGYDGVEGLLMERVRVPPVLRPGDLLVKIHAASVNPIDTAIIGGYGRDVLNVMRVIGQLERGAATTTPTEFPLTAGRDFAGEVVSVGHGVQGVSVGDKVLGVVSPQAQGTHAEYAITSASNVCLMPDTVTPEEAASVPYAALTAWSAVVVSGLVTPASAPRARVLVLGASGGVGTLLCQLLTAWGAQVVGVCSSDALGLVTSLGADALDYTDPATKDVLRTDGRFDLVINAAGTDDLDYLDALRPWMGSSFVTLSPPLLRNIDSDGMALGLLKSVKEVVCHNTSSLSEGRAYKWAFYMPNPWALKQITKMLSTYKIRPVIDKVFPFTETPAAYQHVLEGHARGKTVISMS